MQTRTDQEPRAENGYRLPPPALQAIVDAPQPPRWLPSPRRDLALLLHVPPLPPISALAQPELRLAGLRIHTRARAACRFDLAAALCLRPIAEGEPQPILGLPPDLAVADAAWSADQRHIAFTHRDPAGEGTQLWLVDVSSRRATRLPTPPVHSVFDAGFDWLPDSSGLLLRLSVGAGAAPPAAAARVPVTMASQRAPQARGLRTYADLLRNEHDAALLDHYATAQLALADLAGRCTPVGDPGLLASASPSPDGRALLVQRVCRPYSYQVPIQRFARDIEVWDRQGRVVHVLARLPAAEQLPRGHDAVPAGPREVHWRADEPATLAWVEALDGGDPARSAVHRDALMVCAAPFDAPPRCLVRLPLRHASVVWGDGSTAVITERWWRSRSLAHWRFAPDDAALEPVRIFDGSLEDRYADPGAVVTWPDAAGRPRLLRTASGHTFWTGPGASPEGERPFIDRWDLGSGQRERLFRSGADGFEQPVCPLDPEGRSWLVTRESPDSPANHCLRTLGLETPTVLTQHPHPTPAWREVVRRHLAYERRDGVALHATLYLPPGYDAGRDGPLPTLLWAYPMEYQSSAAAGQVGGSPQRFRALSWWGPEAFVALGYAVLDDPGMPIIGSPDTPANDSFIAQLVANAEAAVQALLRLGVAEPGRLAVGGHSFGAFMVANLLAHTRLFSAGIARSGAYNRSLTPFGFQSEERHYWQAREVYRAVSPFDHAERIEAPLLLIHGEQDPNPGTFPMQSERMFAALQGLGREARLVMLPHEGHRYAARESILHMLAEMSDWLQRHLRPA